MSDVGGICLIIGIVVMIPGIIKLALAIYKMNKRK